MIPDDCLYEGVKRENETLKRQVKNLDDLLTKEINQNKELSNIIIKMAEDIDKLKEEIRNKKKET